MRRMTFRWGWAVVLLSMATLACTCGLVSGLTQAGEGLQTVQAIGTELATSGALETIQAVVTEGGLEQTAEALATEAEGGGFAETAEAIATQSAGGGGITFGDVPADVPVMEDPQGLFGTESTVSYSTSVEYNTVLEFYKKEMPANGWAEDTSQTSVETTGAAVLYYVKDGRTATVTISLSAGQTFVQILIQ